MIFSLCLIRLTTPCFFDASRPHDITGTALIWFSSYLEERKQAVHYRGTKSSLSPLLCGVPQGSVLGLVLFLLYTAELQRIIEDMQLHPHLYADDTQIYGCCAPAKVFALKQRMSACIDKVAEWMGVNRLHLNATKTEVLWCASSGQQSKLPDMPLSVGSDIVTPVKSVRDLDIFIDNVVSMCTHISKTVANCFAALRQL